MGALEAVTCITLHLEGLNSISHLDSLPEVGPGLTASSHCQSLIQPPGRWQYWWRDALARRCPGGGRWCRQGTKLAQGQSPEAHQMSPGPSLDSSPSTTTLCWRLLRIPGTKPGRATYAIWVQFQDKLWWLTLSTLVKGFWKIRCWETYCH